MNDPLEAKIRELALSLGADYFGVADLAPARDAILAQGGAEIARYPRAISIGIALLHPIVDRLPQRSERAALIHYRQHGYEVVNLRLDAIISQLSSALQRAGCQALPIPAAKRVDNERLCAAFSHKMAAHLAGLGWIGKSCLLVTPENGPRVRWATILTNAPLAPTGAMTSENCGECSECVDICPVQAFTGRAFHPEEPRELRYRASLCDQYLEHLKVKDPETAVCGLCLYVCPYGRQASRKLQTN